MSELQMSQLQLEPRSGRKRKRGSLFWTGIILFLLLCTVLVTIYIGYPFASEEEVSYFEGENPILFNQEQMGNALVQDGSIYLPYSFVQSQIDEALYYEEASQSIILTTTDKVVEMPSNSLTYFINQEPVQLRMPVFHIIDDEPYISLAIIEHYYPIKVSILGNNGLVWIEQDGDSYQSAQIVKEIPREAYTKLRTEPTYQSPYYIEVEEGEQVRIEREDEDFYFVRNNQGIAGYIEKEFVEAGEDVVISVEKEQQFSEPLQIDEPIHLTWEAVYTSNPNTELLPEMPGVHVVSPTWFSLANENGDVANLGSIEYSNWAHERGFQVWGLFSNSFDPALTHEVFNTFEKREYVIRQLLHFSQLYHLDGINLDIENVNQEDGPLVTQFVREAAPYFHEAGLVLSMDITFISTSGNWSAFYERDKLADLVDYLIVMAYDEHWATSPIAGSVASLPWVETNLQTLLEVVPPDRLLLGVPLYTRLWKEEMTAEGTEVSSEALSMAQAKEWVDSRGITPTYDPVSGQNYAEWVDQSTGAIYKMWLEDAVSLEKRADLAENYGLAGIGTWSRYFADETAWTALQMEESEEEI
ncbi:spore germination protein YaaH [Bacillus oleivorans]|uniref:Spore germination protein YaaH n=1 Tax=Bacillus oleivorans TaxID=1448271 RepID=A0A285D757_9BACI|nr:glycosyl hydrolase family 18 protein [Bacillus oleivorans]SNX74993.1 spore germination protein YaaH [Bacillus oleivorans]